MKRPELQKMGCDDVILKDPQKWGVGVGLQKLFMYKMVQSAPGHGHLEIQVPEVQWTVF